jgi:hypothetical protein
MTGQGNNIIIVVNISIEITLVFVRDLSSAMKYAIGMNM